MAAGPEEALIIARGRWNFHNIFGRENKDGGVIRRINHRPDRSAQFLAHLVRAVSSKRHENNAGLVGRADNRTCWNLTNLRVGCPLTNVFGLALIAGKREVLLAPRLLGHNYVDSHFLFAFLTPTRKVIVWHQSTPLFLASAEFTSSILSATKSQKPLTVVARLTQAGR
jgi:hypothetical protein